MVLWQYIHANRAEVIDKAWNVSKKMVDMIGISTYGHFTPCKIFSLAAIGLAWSALWFGFHGESAKER